MSFAIAVTAPSVPFALRVECPPGACDCQRDALLATPGADMRILRLTREEEKKLVQRLEQVRSLEELRHLQGRMREQLGIEWHIAPGPHEVRTLRGITIELLRQPGLCRKTRQALPAAIRRSMERTPAIAFALLDAHDLLGQG